MFDPFDAFDPIDPVPDPAPAPEAQRVEDVERGKFEAVTEPSTPDQTGHDETAGLADQPRGRDADARSDASGAHRPERRWGAYPRRAPQPGSVGMHPRRDERTESETFRPGPDRSPSQRALSPEDVATLRAVTLPALRSAAERLRARGHDTVLVEALDADEPTVTVLLRPDPGPLAAPGTASGNPARFELRLEPGDSGPQVLTRVSTPEADGSTIQLESAPLAEVDATWVGRPFIEFVQRSLASS